jgi:hypothetical protein
MFLAGYRIDLRKMDFSQVIGPHQEITYAFEKETEMGLIKHMIHRPPFGAAVSTAKYLYPGAKIFNVPVALALLDETGLRVLSRLIEYHGIKSVLAVGYLEDVHREWLSKRVQLISPQPDYGSVDLLYVGATTVEDYRAYLAAYFAARIVCGSGYNEDVAKAVAQAYPKHQFAGSFWWYILPQGV